MAVKFQFQFAGADFSRPSSPYRKWLRIGLISFVSVLAGLGYWAYLHHLTLGRRLVLPHVVSGAAQTAVLDSVKPVTPVAPMTATAMPPTLKKIADDSILAAGNELVKAVKISPAAPMPTTVPTAKPLPVAVAAPTISFAPRPVAVRPFRVHTDQERLLMAGETAFDNVMDLANKYPDAYGFQAQDFLADAKLGAPLPVYTIEESDRANYQSGQPIKPLLKRARQWVFPVMMSERICCMVEVTQTGREYVPGKGNKSLAMAWSKICEKWPVEEGYHPMLLVNPEVPGYYFTVPELPEQNITDTIEMFYFHPGISPADVILASWR